MAKTVRYRVDFPRDLPTLVEDLAWAIWQGLEADGWGDIEPDTFYNIGIGFTGVDDLESEVEEKLMFNKISQEEMLDSIKSMRTILTRAVEEMVR